jgi:hypothetical protein
MDALATLTIVALTALLALIVGNALFRRPRRVRGRSAGIVGDHVLWTGFHGGSDSDRHHHDHGGQHDAWPGVDAHDAGGAGDGGGSCGGDGGGGGGGGGGGD